MGTKTKDRIVLFLFVSVIILSVPYSMMVLRQGGAVADSTIQGSIDPAPVLFSPARPALKDLSYYQNLTSSRDIFNFRPKTVGEDTGRPVVVAAGTQDPSMTNLKLRGVVIDDQPQAVIFDVVQNRSFVLNVGESIQGAVLKNVQQGRVVLENGGQTVELIQQ